MIDLRSVGDGAGDIVWQLLAVAMGMMLVGGGVAVLADRLGLRDSVWPVFVRMLALAGAVWWIAGSIADAWSGWARHVWSVPGTAVGSASGERDDH